MKERTEGAYVRIYKREGFVMAIQLPMETEEIIERLLRDIVPVKLQYVNDEGEKVTTHGK